MSGELLRVRIDLGCSIVTEVRRFGTPSSASTWSSQSPSTTRSLRLKRVGVGLRVAPRPWLDSTGIRQGYAVQENITRTDERPAMNRLSPPTNRFAGSKCNFSFIGEPSLDAHQRARQGL